MKAKENIVTRYDETIEELKNTLKDFFNNTESSLTDISKATKLSNPFLSEIKGYLNDKPGARQYSPDKIRNVLADLYKANMIK